MNWIKEHPYLSGGLVLLVVVYFVIRGRHSSAGASTAVVQSGPSPQVQAAQLAAGTALQQSQIQATNLVNTLNAQLAAKQLDTQANVTIADFARQAKIQDIVTQGQVQQLNINAAAGADMQHTAAALESVKLQIGGQVDLGRISAGRDVALAGTQADILKAQYDAATKQAAVISKAQTDQAAITAGTLINQQNRSADLQYAAIEAGKDVTINNTNRSADIAYTQLTTKSAADLAAIDAAKTITLNGQDVSGKAYSDYLLATLQSQQANLNFRQDALGVIAGGSQNKGGEGGQNQAQEFGALFGAPIPGSNPTGNGFSVNIPGVGSVSFGGL